VFSYARRLLTSRPALWGAALACSALLALPGAVVALLFVRSLTMLLLTADLALAWRVAPAGVTGRGWIPLALVGGALLSAVVFHRFYALLLWESEEENESGWRTSWRSTRRAWTKVLALNVSFWVGLIVLVGILAAITAAVLSASPGAATFVLLLGVTVVVGARTVGRVALTLAQRAALLDDLPVRQSWRSGVRQLRRGRRQAVAAWATLLALGVAVWLGGRLATPILQDTAFDFPIASRYALAREGAQLVFAIPLETFLLVVAVAIWTAVFRGIDVEEQLSSSGSFLPRALATLVVLVIIGNGIAAIADVAWRNDLEDRQRRIRAREISPEDALSVSGPPTIREPDHSRYEVRAKLRGDELRWNTRITYTNRFATPVDELPVYVYPAAFVGDVEDMPLAEDLLATPGRVGGQLRSGTFEVVSVTTEGNGTEWERDGTLLRIPLDETLERGERVRVKIALEAELPAWPLRYGIWNGVTQLGNWIPTVPVQDRSGFVIHPYGDIGDPFFSPLADYEVTIVAEVGVGVVGTGRLTEIVEREEDRSWRFEAPATRDVAFAAGSSLRGLESGAAPTVRTWYDGQDSLEGERVAEAAASALAYFTRTFGELDTPEIDVVRVTNPLGGMEYPGLVFVSSGFSQLEGLPLLPDLVDQSDFETVQERYVTGHELAHQWWYAAVGNDQVREPWLDEGFAEASTRLWLLAEDGNERAWTIAHLEDDVDNGSRAIASSVDSFATNTDYAETIYDAGGELLLELRSSIGTQNYDQLMAEWYRSRRGDIGTIESFIELVKRRFGEDARGLLERRLRGSAGGDRETGHRPALRKVLNHASIDEALQERERKHVARSK
jgi:hypothetical protein